MNRTLVTLRRNGLLVCDGLQNILLPPAREKGVAALARQGIDRLTDAICAGYTRLEIAQYCGCSIRTFYYYQKSLSKSDIEYLAVCEYLKAKDIEKQLIKDVWRKCQLDFSDYSDDQLPLIKLSLVHVRICLKAVQKIIDRFEQKASQSEEPDQLPPKIIVQRVA